MTFNKPIQLTVPAELRERIAAILGDTWDDDYNEIIDQLRTPDALVCVDNTTSHVCTYDEHDVGTCVDCGATIYPEV